MLQRLGYGGCQLVMGDPQELVCGCWGTPKRMVYHGKSHLERDDITRRSVMTSDSSIIPFVGIVSQTLSSLWAAHMWNVCSTLNKLSWYILMVQPHRLRSCGFWVACFWKGLWFPSTLTRCYVEFRGPQSSFCILLTSDLDFDNISPPWDRKDAHCWLYSILQCFLGHQGMTCVSGSCQHLKMLVVG